MFITDSGEESDPDMNEWENQQIRKGVTGAQLLSAQQESAYYTQYLMRQQMESLPLSTGNLLAQAYARSSLEKPRQILLSTQKSYNKPSGPRKPEEVLANMMTRFTQINETHEKHTTDVEQITKELKLIEIDCLEIEQNAPLIALKYDHFQELRAYVQDLIECLNEKVMF